MLKPDRQITRSITILTETSATFGSIKNISGVIDPFITDTFKQNNTDTAYVTIRGSFDPNDKQVFPFHHINIDSVQKGKQILEYTVRFQNTGNDTAFLVHIADTLSSKLDFSSLKLVSSSHPVELDWKNPNFLHFYFRNILLPDSNVNEKRSHGFVKFSVRPKTTLSPGDSITNGASIYFDYNSPVVTNRVITMFKNDITGINIVSPGYKMHIHPNPTRGTLSYSFCCFVDVTSVEISVHDLLGKILLKEKKGLPGERFEGSLNVSSLPAGTYLLKVSTKKGVSSVKFVKH
jgi:uncharacterized repeat protein (TIGR01451 family)